jgi:hypothetical protein
VSLPYLKAQGCEDRVVEGLTFNLKRIRKADGYNTDIGDVLEDPPAAPDKIANYPAVVIVFGEERNFSESYDMQELIVPVFLYCHIREGERPSRAVRLFKRDILSVLGNFWALPDSEGIPTCGRAKYVSSLPFARVNAVPAAGTRIGLEVSYHQLTQDQTQN